MWIRTDDDLEVAGVLVDTVTAWYKRVVVKDSRLIAGAPGGLTMALVGEGGGSVQKWRVVGLWRMW